jgi:pyrimidine-nucleoside phosphorylase
LRAVDLIIKKRNGGKLSAGEIEFLIDGFIHDKIPDYQLSAFAMAVFFRGMDFEETGFLTRVMLDSGQSLDLSAVLGPKIDKHSTGGVGDKISLILAPIVAACGVKVPMMCGRGLGHTGGTIDKLEAIPGYRTGLREEEILNILNETGFVFMGQTESMVPADKRLYALRDVTGTVESVPLITASILSKKAAEGADGFVFDVKCGSGAFMKTKSEAVLLARSLVGTARWLGKKARAVITAMDEPLGRMVGNLLEVKESVECLLGNMTEDIAEITFALGARMLLLADKVKTFDEGIALCRAHVADKSAYQLFLKNVSAQGGDPGAIADPHGFSAASNKIAVRVKADGFVTGLDAYKIGVASMLLGAGRENLAGRIEPLAGIELAAKRGDKIKRGDALCFLHVEEGIKTDEARLLVESAYTIGGEEIKTSSRILSKLDDV